MCTTLRASIVWWYVTMHRVISQFPSPGFTHWSPTPAPLPVLPIPLRDIQSEQYTENTWSSPMILEKISLNLSDYTKIMNWHMIEVRNDETGSHMTWLLVFTWTSLTVPFQVLVLDSVPWISAHLYWPIFIYGTSHTRILIWDAHSRMGQHFVPYKYFIYN